MTNTPSWILIISWATKLVLILLVFLSVWSVSILVDRKKRLGSFLRDSEGDRIRDAIRNRDGAAIRGWAEKGTSLQAQAMREILSAPQNPEAIAYAQKSYLADRRAELSKGLPVLATLGSNAPFIGLFGTVLGIIQSFGALATSSAAMNTVIFSLAEALIATAVGLFVAIPATVAYNTFTQKIRSAISESESLRDLYLSRFVLSGGK
jgi:biopolymer transport protein ExbB/TolQ